MSEKVSISSVSDIITSKNDRQYFTFEDTQQKRYVCFIPQLKDYCKVGSEIEVDFTPGKSPEDSPRLDMIYVNGKAVISVEKKAQRQSYGKSDKELTQIRQLAEAQNRSIQAQTALNRAVDIVVAEMNLGHKGEGIWASRIEELAKDFYRTLQSLTQISEAEIILKGAKDVKASPIQTHPPATSVVKAEADKEVVVDEGRPQVLQDPMTLQEFLKWVASHGKSFTPSWICETLNIGKVSEIKDFAEAQQVLKEKMNWE